MVGKKSFLKKSISGFAGLFLRLSIAQMVALLFAIFVAVYLVIMLVLGTPHFLATVVSGSMEPALFRGDIAVISKSNEYFRGEIIVFKRGEDIIIHRVTGITENAYRTKGDDNPFTDAVEVKRSQVIGKAVFVIPWLGNINLFLAGK